jgi:Leu/Phe-tRNA-protein transferase
VVILEKLWTGEVFERFQRVIQRMKVKPFNKIFERARRRRVRIKDRFDEVQRRCEISRKNHRRIWIGRVIEL